MGATYALVGGAVPMGQTNAYPRRWRGLGQLALAAALAVGFLSLLRAPAPVPALGTPAQPAGTSVHGPGALSFHVGPSGALEVAAGSSDALRVVPAGFGRGAIRPLESTTKAASGVAATYDQGALSVWYSHRGDALDQGFTVARRLPGMVNKVVIALNTSGALRPELDSPTSLSFEGSKVPAITYSSLKVTDATGRVLPARLGVSGTSVRIMFNDRHAVYPVRVDPWIQQSLLTPPAGSQAFGSALATSSNGTTVLVGDPGANQATVYTSSGGQWSSGVELTTPMGSVSFGTSVALSSNGAVALVGDPSGGGGDGAAYVYTLTSGVWSSGVALTPPSGSVSFGTSVALSGPGTKALVGDPDGGTETVGIGAATVYTFTTSWNSGTNLASPATPEEFGTSVALSNSGSIAVVGDPTAGTDQRGLVTSFSGNNWSTAETLEMKPNVAGPGGFGTSVAVSSAGTTLVVGDPTSPAGAGSAGIYTGSLTDSAITSWAQTSTLTAPSGAQAFGTSVAITAAGTEALVGDATGGAGNGAASSYSAPSGTWSATAAANALAAPPFPGNFGTAVAVSGDASSAFVGDPNGSSANPSLDGTVTAYTSNGRSWSLGTVPVLPLNSNSFGSAVSLSSAGTTMLEGDVTGIDSHGATSVYTYNGSTLSTPSTLTRPAGASSFGTSVAISANGSTAVVGDPNNTSDEANDMFGTATVYTSTGSGWSSGTALAVPENAFEFGNSVAISASGNEILVGDPEGGENGTGAVTEFTLSGGTWSAGTPLSTPTNTYTFGTTVALSANGNVALVADPGPPGPGSVIPYTLSNGIFSEGNPIPTPANASAFGTSLALSQTGNVALVGDPTGGSLGKGAATVFTDNAGSWVQNSSLVPVGTAGQFGASVALSASGATALVGDPVAQTYGTATVYDFNGSWSTGTPLSVTANAGNFGTAVALSADGTIAAVGDPNGGNPGGEVTVFSLDATTAATDLSASANPSSATVGSQITYSATISGGRGTPTGTVTFSTGLLTLCTASVSGGVASCPASNTPLGAGAVFATYSGDANNAPSSASTPVTITSPSTTDVSVAPTSVTEGATVTYSANVSPTTGSGTPTGTVAFSTGGTALCTATLASGSGSCTASNAPEGTDTVAGHYSGDSTYSASSSSTSLTVNAPPSPPPPPSPPSPPPTPPATPHGYWLVGSDGGIFTFGSSQFYGSTGSLTLQRPVVGISPTADRNGYWLVASDGGVFAYGDAGFVGSIPGLGLHPAGSGLPNSLNAPIVGIVPSHDGGGYFMVASDGGVFAFGDAHFAGSCPGIGGCSGSAVDVMPDASGNGYWIVTSSGNVYGFGDAAYYGSPGHGSVTSAVATPDGKGYWVLLSDGQVFAYGSAANLGSPPSGAFNAFDPANAIFATSDGGGYWVSSAAGAVFTFGDAPNDGSMAGTRLNGAIIAGNGY